MLSDRAARPTATGIGTAGKLFPVSELWVAVKAAPWASVSAWRSAEPARARAMAASLPWSAAGSIKAVRPCEATHRESRREPLLEAQKVSVGHGSDNCLPNG